MTTAVGTYLLNGPQPDVRFGSKADMCSAKGHVRFTPKADMQCLVFNEGDADGYAATTCVAAA